MTTPIIPNGDEAARRAHQHAVVAFLRSRIDSQLAYGDVDRYHRDDCSSLGMRLIDCDCDGPENITAYLQTIRSALDMLAPPLLPPDRLPYELVLLLARPWEGRRDFPTLAT